MADTSSSSASGSRSRSSSASPVAPSPLLTRVKAELPSPRRRRGGLVINERQARTETPPRGHLRLVKPKLEPGTGGASSSRLRRPKTELEWEAPSDYVRSAIKLGASEDDEEFPGQKVAEQASFNDVVPADLEFACALSRAEHERIERERQRLLLEQATRRRARQDFAARTGAVIVIDSDDDGHGDDGAGPSSRAPPAPPSDDGDYMVFYSQLGL